MSPTEVLTAEDRAQFLDKGYVKLTGCFSAEEAESRTRYIWDRLGYRADDPATWAKASVHMAAHEDIDVSTFAPKAWQAACELVGGADRLTAAKNPFPWTDAFIVNLRQETEGPWQPPSPATPGWHVDGSWFRHYLDSPEQGLLAIVLWSDVVHEGGPTFVTTDSVAPVARFLADHPEGVLPNGHSDATVFDYQDLAGQCHEYVEATGTVGDVYLLHPFVVHAKSENALRVPRFITNSTLFLAEPMRFNRPDPADHSLVEQAVLRALGVDSYDFVPTGPRERVVPDSAGAYDAQAVEERRRLAAAGHPNYR
ncbi:hypothetical protein SAMN05421812_12761 [Asanoa hainanensis]|uniref:Phytanoyl-CoA dioxygenase (PhyH) n=1 Tax=Asanoa hainanensis TaxID=560556 RepID=A0A239PFQ1_9ACTN|nr:hypothetical protein [Asanoa hainanensis]SNT65852.1 hypothetical protein SAMN05421812_12761 [Asanoa hainanensis]